MKTNANWYRNKMGVSSKSIGLNMSPSYYASKR